MDVCGSLKHLGVDLRSILNDALDSTPIKVEGTAVHFRFVVRNTVRSDKRKEVLDRFLVKALRHGVLIHRDANNVNLGMHRLSPSDGGLQVIGDVVNESAQ